MYSKILQAAEERAEFQMVTRLRGAANGDLVAVEARYHRKKNVAAKMKTWKEENAYEKTIHQLIEDFKPKIESKQVFLLSTPRDYFRNLL